jgi:putative transposase
MEIQNTTKKYKTSNTSIYSCQYHVIFCPKYRRKIFVDGIDKRLKELIKEKEQKWNYEVIEMEVMPEHVHLLLDIDPKVGVYNVVNHIKGYASKVLRKEYPSLRSRLPCLWSRSKFISTVGSVSLETVKQYIENQKGK